MPALALRQHDSELAYTRREREDDEVSDYGEVLDGTGTAMDVRMLDRDMEARLERELDGFGSEEDVADEQRRYPTKDDDVRPGHRYYEGALTVHVSFQRLRCCHRLDPSHQDPDSSS